MVNLMGESLEIIRLESHSGIEKPVRSLGSLQ